MHKREETNGCSGSAFNASSRWSSLPSAMWSSLVLLLFFVFGTIFLSILSSHTLSLDVVLTFVRDDMRFFFIVFFSASLCRQK